MCVLIGQTAKIVREVAPVFGGSHLGPVLSSQESESGFISINERQCMCGIAHVLATANITGYKPIESDVIIRGGNLHVREKISRSVIREVDRPWLISDCLIIEKFLRLRVNFPQELYRCFRLADYDICYSYNVRNTESPLTN